jgi:hypothetical protein
MLYGEECQPFRIYTFWCGTPRIKKQYKLEFVYMTQTIWIVALLLVPLQFLTRFSVRSIQE